MREVSPGVYEIGKIHLDQKARTVRFPGLLNMKDGNLEYLLVTDQGNIHESLLSSATSNRTTFTLPCSCSGPKVPRNVSGEMPLGDRCEIFAPLLR